MANYNAIDCITGNAFVINDGGNPISLNEIWYVGGLRDSDRFCVTIQTENIRDVPSYSALTEHSDCETCLNTNRFNIILGNCDMLSTIILPFSAFTTTFPSGNTVFYLSIDIDGRTTTNGCFFVKQSTRADISRYLSILSNTSHLNCETCYIDNLTSYLVEQCDTLSPFYVLLPSNFVGGEFISFNPIGSLDQFCGEVIRQEVGTIDAIYLSTFNDCTDCLSQTSVTRELISCIDNTVEIVFASALYNLNESSFLTINDPNEGFSGCYRIGDISTDPITVTGYLSYSPSPSCEDCIACNGFEFEYFVCGEPGLSGSVYSRQYIQTGQTFYHPISGCCEVSAIITANTSTDTFLSFYEYTTCEECTGSTIGYETWVATDCRDSISILISLPLGYTSGNVLTVNYGTLTTTCVTLDVIYTNESITTYAKTTEVSYTDCPTCWSNTFVAYPFAKCGENVATYYNLSLTNYYTILDNVDNGNYIFTNTSYECFYILNGCATSQYTEFGPMNFFNSCLTCNAPLSTGTETNVCNVCWDGTGYTTTIVSNIPHPQWTNGQNKTIIMLDAIVLGGTNGLNN